MPVAVELVAVGAAEVEGAHVVRLHDPLLGVSLVEGAVVAEEEEGEVVEVVVVEVDRTSLLYRPLGQCLSV